MSTAGPRDLTPGVGQVDVAGYEENGFVGPFTLATPAQMYMVALHLIGSVFTRPGPDAEVFGVNRHIDAPVVAQLATHPEIAGRAEALLGPDLVVWRTVFFAKGADGEEIPWHQDLHFWRLEPPLTLTAWIAIDRAHRDDNCMEVIPGSHLSDVPHVRAPGSVFGEMAAPEMVDVTRAVPLEAEAGQFFLFDRRLLHRSRPGGKGQGRRLALSVRIAPAFVTIDPSLLPASGEVLPMRGVATRE